MERALVQRMGEMARAGDTNPALGKLLKTIARADQRTGSQHCSNGQNNNGANYTIFAFDTTGSMSGVIKRVRDDVREISRQIFEQEQGVQIMVAGIGDHCDGPNYLQFTSYASSFPKLEANMSGIQNTGGGDGPEAYECFFKRLRTGDYIKGRTNLVVIGDSVPHGMDGCIGDGGCPLQVDYRQELAALNKMVDSLYFVGCDNSQQMISFQRRLVEPESSKRKFLLLDDIMLITQFLIAVTKKAVSEKSYRNYMNLLQASSKPQDQAAAKKIAGYLK